MMLRHHEGKNIKKKATSKEKDQESLAPSFTCLQPSTPASDGRRGRGRVRGRVRWWWLFHNRRQIGRLLADDHDKALCYRPRAFAKFMMALSSGRLGGNPLSEAA